MFLLWIVIAIWIIGLLVAVFVVGRLSAKDNPDTGFVFVKTGDRVNRPIKAKRTTTNSKGSRYVYGNKSVFVPSRYKEVYHRTRRMIFVNRIGQLIATPLQDDVSLDDAEKETLIAGLFDSHIGADGIKAVKGLKVKASNILIIIIAVGIGIVLTYGVIKFMDTQNQKQQTTEQQTNENLPSQNMPIEVK